MFPDIIREDIFRLETRRLWLRWPVLADAGDVAGFLGSGGTPETASGDPFAAPPAVDRETIDTRKALPTLRHDALAEVGNNVAILTDWRVGNASGMSLSLILTGRGTDRRGIGAVSLSPVRGRIDQCGLRLQAWLDPGAAGQGLGTEAVQAIVDIAFMLTATPLVAASSRVLDPGFRRVLEKCGFTSCGTGLDPAPDGRGLAASDRFRLDRKAWSSLKNWRVPDIRRDVSPAAVSTAC